jgi:hypothetical protein
LKDFFEPVSHAAIINRKIDFLVQGKRPIIEVGAADRRPDTIDYYCLGVHERGFVLKNLNASEKKGFIMTARRGCRTLIFEGRLCNY